MRRIVAPPTHFKLATTVFEDHSSHISSASTHPHSYSILNVGNNLYKISLLRGQITFRDVAASTQ